MRPADAVSHAFASDIRMMLAISKLCSFNFKLHWHQIKVITSATVVFYFTKRMRRACGDEQERALYQKFLLKMSLSIFENKKKNLEP